MVKLSLGRVSVKHLEVSKDQSRILMVVAGTVALVIFFLFATKAMIVQGLYQQRVLSAKHGVVSDLKKNYVSAKALVNQYQVFADQDPNMLGAPVSGSGNLNGDNPRLTLDALPSKYDAPALASSMEKVLTGRNVKIASITVKDDPTLNPDQPQSSPKYTALTFSVAGAASFSGANQLLTDLERSIRPFDVNKLRASGTDSNLTLSMEMTTYYQPGKIIDLKPTREVK